MTSSGLSEYKSTSRPTIGGRKRTRDDYNEATRTTVEDEVIPSNPGSPMPFVNTKYRLAGGMDTPTLAAAQLDGADGGDYSDAGYRKNLNGRPSLVARQSTSYFPALEELPREANGRPRPFQPSQSFRSLSSQEEGWVKPALGVVGGVVSKVWEFCKTSAFRGFHAGAGTGYTLPTTPLNPEMNNVFWGTQDKPSGLGLDNESTPLPGQFPEEDFIIDYMDHATPEESPEPRAAKRRQVGGSNGEEIAKNWIMVPPSEKENPTPSRSRGPARYSMPTASSAGRRTNVGGGARHQTRAPAAASGVRRQILQPKVSHAGSPGLQSNRGASFASPRSPGGTVKARISPKSAAKSTNGNRPESPAAIEAQKWAALKRKEDRQADESIRRLDAQLKAMIREGKEALGTKIEVDEFDDDYASPGPESKKWVF